MRSAESEPSAFSPQGSGLHRERCGGNLLGPSCCVWFCFLVMPQKHGVNLPSLAGVSPVGWGSWQEPLGGRVFRETLANWGQGVCFSSETQTLLVTIVPKCGFLKTYSFQIPRAAQTDSSV